MHTELEEVDTKLMAGIGPMNAAAVWRKSPASVRSAHRWIGLTLKITPQPARSGSARGVGEQIARIALEDGGDRRSVPNQCCAAVT